METNKYKNDWGFEQLSPIKSKSYYDIILCKFWPITDFGENN